MAWVWRGGSGLVGRMVGWVVGVVTGRCWWLVGDVTHVLVGGVGLFVHVRVVVPFLQASLPQFV